MTKFPKVRTHHNSKSDTNDYSKVPKSLSTFTSSSTHKIFLLYIERKDIQRKMYTMSKS